MRGGCESLRNTVVYSMGWPLNATGVCVSAAGWPTIFTTNMGGVRRLVTGENGTTVCGVFVESATHLGTERNER
jgi:hypothetical protein